MLHFLHFPSVTGDWSLVEESYGMQISDAFGPHYVFGDIGLRRKKIKI